MSLSKSKIFLIFCLAFIIGVFFGRYISYEFMVFAAMFFVAIISIGWKNKLAIVLGLAGFVALGGALRFSLAASQNDLAQFYDQKVSGIGIVVEEPDQRTDKTYLTLGKLQVSGQNLKSRLLLSVARFPEYEYGQKLDFQVKIQEPKDSEEFSYKNYLSRFGIAAVGYFPKVEISGSNQGNVIKASLLKFKKVFVSKIAQVLPEPQNSFLAGLLVGLRRTIPQDLQNQLAATGTTHVIAISGYNITIIASAINGILLFFFRRKISFVVAFLAIVCFVIMSGASASAVRAGIMGVMGMVALNIGRVNASNNALAFTAAVMLGFNPQILHFDVGFQLSFLALMGLVYLCPLMEPHLLWVPKGIRKYLLPSIGAYIFTLPILLFDFGRLSLVAIPVNALVLPMVPAAMLFGFVTGGLGLVWLPLAKIAAWFSWASLTYILKIVGWSASIPLSSVGFSLSKPLVIIFYIFLVLFLFAVYNKQKLVELINLWKDKQKSSVHI